MTYLQLKNVVKGLLTGDNMLTKDDDVVISLLGMAFNHIAMKAESLHLLTIDKDVDILRLGVGGYVTRTPYLPVVDSDVLDIDPDLCYAAARMIASYVSKQGGQYHKREAEEIITMYNGKVYTLLESINIDGGLEDDF